jgi:branched-chain amino acid transport system substrate-binding protein
VYLGGPGTAIAPRIFDALEKAWSVPTYRPRYLAAGSFSSEEPAFIGKDPDRRARVLGETSASMTNENAKFVMRYNEVFEEKTSLTMAPSSAYDAFYVMAYAAYASGQEAPTGVEIARGISRLVPPGRPIEVGPTRIYDGFNALLSGASINLVGAASGLDFDPATGEVPTDQVILCAGVDKDGAATDAVEAGLVYDATTQKLRGNQRCP